MNLAIDTDVVSFTYKKDSRAVLYEPYLRSGVLTISFMTLTELKFWTLGNNWSEKRKKNFAKFLEDYLVIYADEKLCETWAKINNDARKNGHPIDTADAWVASVALLYDIPLVTHNRRHFENVENLSVISES